MVLERAKDISVTVILPSQAQRQLTFSNNLTVNQVLQHIREEKMMSRPVKDYFIKYGDKELDAKLPLHAYNIEKGEEFLRIVPYKINLHVIDEYSNKLCVFVDARLDTVLDIKQQIIGDCKFKRVPMGYQPGQDTLLLNFSKEYSNPKRIKLFMQNGESYNLLEDECPIKDYELDNHTELFMIYYDWGDHHLCCRLIGKPTLVKSIMEPGTMLPREHNNAPLSFFAHGTSGECISFKYDDNVSWARSTLSLALRIQEHFDIPVENIKMNSWIEISPYKNFLHVNSTILIVDKKAMSDDPWAN